MLLTHQQGFDHQGISHLCAALKAGLAGSNPSTSCLSVAGSTTAIETFYIPKRLHSALGHISALEFEKLLMEKENQKK